MLPRESTIFTFPFGEVGRFGFCLFKQFPSEAALENVTYGLLCDPFTSSDLEFIKTYICRFPDLCDPLFPFFVEILQRYQ